MIGFKQTNCRRRHCRTSRHIIVVVVLIIRGIVDIGLIIIVLIVVVVVAEIVVVDDRLLDRLFGCVGECRRRGRRDPSLPLRRRDGG